MGTTRICKLMIQITEKRVVQLGLAFLKSHYRHLPRFGETQTREGVEAEGGIIADGFFAFRQSEDGPTFSATLEATDYLSREELRYTWFWELLIIDGIAGTLGIMAFISGWLHLRGYPSVYPAGPFLALVVLLVVFILGIISWVIIFHRRSRYHYIYAVEQFKSYFADDQWVAFAWDVFSSTEDKYYKELRKQCIRYGFGLLEIDREQHVKMHLAPAKADLFSNKRAVRQFFSSTSRIAQRIRQEVSTRLPSKVRTRSLTIPGIDIRDLFRFRRSYRYQGFISASALLLLGIVFWLELQEYPIQYADQPAVLRKREELILDKRGQSGMESRVFLVDAAALPPPMLEVGPYLLTGSNATDVLNLGPPKGEVYLYVDQAFVSFSCERIAQSGSDLYLVFLNSYADIEWAKNRALALRNSGIRVNIIWADCFFPGRRFFIIYFEDLFNTFEDAQLARQQIADQILDAQFDFENHIGRISR